MILRFLLRRSPAIRFGRTGRKKAGPGAGCESDERQEKLQPRKGDREIGRSIITARGIGTLFHGRQVVVGFDHETCREFNSDRKLNGVLKNFRVFDLQPPSGRFGNANSADSEALIAALAAFWSNTSYTIPCPSVSGRLYESTC